MKELATAILACDNCKAHLPLGPRPIFVAHKESRILIISQAPGAVVHKSGIAWTDKSGERLREWLGVNETQFYNPKLFAIMPMGFCYPGRGKSGDLPPRKECAPLWHERLLAEMPQLQLILVIGQYAQKNYLGKTAQKNLTETVRNYKNYLPKYFPLPHPSPRNNIWIKKNEWMEKEVIPELKFLIKAIITA